PPSGWAGFHTGSGGSIRRASNANSASSVSSSNSPRYAVRRSGMDESDDDDKEVEEKRRDKENTKDSDTNMEPDETTRSGFETPPTEAEPAAPRRFLFARKR